MSMMMTITMMTISTKRQILLTKKRHNYLL